MKKLRVLHVIHGLARGGLENGVVTLSNHMPDDEFVQAICCLDSVGEMAERLKPGIEVFCLNRGRYDIGAIMRLADLYKRWKPDVIHSRNWNSWLDSVLAKHIGARSAALVWSFHGFLGTETFPWRRKMVSRLLDKSTDQLAAVCHDSAKRYADASGIDVDRFEVMYNGVDIDRFSTNRSKEELRTSLGIPNDAVLVTTVASLTPVKDHESLIEAAKQVVQECKEEFLFLWIGTGPLLEKLKSTIEGANLGKRIILVGTSDCVPLYLSASDFFVLPSKLEGMSNAILEAMAAGLPVVANRVGGNVELVRHNKTGFLCMQGDSSTLANAILKLIRDAELRKQQSKAARDLAMSEFSMEAMLRRYGDFYRRVSR